MSTLDWGGWQLERIPPDSQAYFFHCPRCGCNWITPRPRCGGKVINGWNDVNQGCGERIPFHVQYLMSVFSALPGSMNVQSMVSTGGSDEG